MNFEGKITRKDENFVYVFNSKKELKLKIEDLNQQNASPNYDYIFLNGNFTIKENIIQITPECKIFTYKREFKLINEMLVNEYCNLYGIVIDYLQPIKTKGTDYLSTVTIMDETGQIDIKIFNRNEYFYNYFCTGDIIFVKKVKLLNNGKSILSGKSVEILFSFKKKIEKMYNTTEKIRIEELKNFYKSSYLFEKEYDDLKIKKCVKKIEELELNDLFNFYGYLIGIKKENDYLTILSFVDYTHNKKVYPKISLGLYENDMILYVKVWGKYANDVLKLKTHTFYYIKNLKVSQNSTTITANISESRELYFQEIENLLKNTKLEENDKINEKYKNLLKLKNEYENKKTNKIIESQNKNHIPNFYKNLKLTELSSLKIGINKVKIKILFCRPYKGINIKFCINCKKIINLDKIFVIDKNDCNHKNCKIFQQFISKLKITDNSSELVVVCKNQILKKILSKREFVRNNMMFGLIICNSNNYHLVDLLLNKNN